MENTGTTIHPVKGGVLVKTNGCFNSHYVWQGDQLILAEGAPWNKSFVERMQTELLSLNRALTNPDR